MKLTIVSFKECWQDERGKWFSYGGFPLQMAAISSLFDEVTMLIVQVPPRGGGIPLPEQARVVAVRRPTGADTRRKLSVLAHFPYYMGSVLKQTRDAEVVHAPVPGDISLLGMFAGLLQGKRLIVRYCGSWPDNAQTTWVNRLTKWSMRTLAGGRNVMLATGIGNGKPPAPQMAWVPATALSEGELREFQPEINRGLQDPPRLAYIGRMTTEKGVDILIRALARLRDENFEPLPQATLIGDGPQYADLERLVRTLGMEKWIHFTMQLDRRELAGCLAGQDFTVQATLSEGLSKAWLDAMAHGLPVIATDGGAAKEVIGCAGERGWLIPPRDEDALVAALKYTLSGPVDWPALRRRCWEFVQGRTIEAWAELIGQTCSGQWNIPLLEGKLRI